MPTRRSTQKLGLPVTLLLCATVLLTIGLALKSREESGLRNWLSIRLPITAPQNTATPSWPYTTEHKDTPTSPEHHLVAVNEADMFDLRQVGFSFYEVCRLLELRSVGYELRSANDLPLVLARRSQRPEHIDSLAQQLDFRPAKQRSIPPHLVASALRLQRGEWTTAGNNDSWNTNYTHTRRIPLFLADPEELLCKGMSKAAADTLRCYQQDYIIGGSTTEDSLLTLPPAALGHLLTSHVKATRYQRGANTTARQPSTTSKSTPTAQVDLNTATAEQLEAIPGIGATTAKEILRYRQKLGGFVSVEQLSEVWCVADRLEQLRPLLTVATTSVRPLNVNSADITRMQLHPYMPEFVGYELLRLRKALRQGHRLTKADVETAFDGKPTSPWFWSYFTTGE